MESTTWQSVNGKWDDAASWTNGVPNSAVDPKIAVLDGKYSNVSVRLGLTGASCQRLITTPDYTGDVGAPGSPLEIYTRRAILRGRGSHYVDFATPIVGDEAVILDSPNLVDAGEISGEPLLLISKGGAWTLGPTGDVDNKIVVTGGDLTIEKASGSEDFYFLLMAGGHVTNKRPQAGTAFSFVVAGGLLDQVGLLTANDQIVIGPSGAVRYAPDEAPAPSDSPRIWALGGLFDVSGSEFEIPTAYSIWGPFAEIAGPVAGPLIDFGDIIDLRKDYP